nr:MAG: hypothetical protein KatS3mg041_0309 [Bacteroidota bacterium]
MRGFRSISVRAGAFWAVLLGQMAWAAYGPQIARGAMREQLGQWLRSEAVRPLDALFEQALERALARATDPRHLLVLFEEGYRELNPGKPAGWYFARDVASASLSLLELLGARRACLEGPPGPIWLSWRAPAISGSGNAAGEVVLDRLLPGRLCPLAGNYGSPFCPGKVDHPALVPLRPRAP